MAQSYGNSSTSTLTAAVDNIQNITLTSQQLGTSISVKSPSFAIAPGLTLSIKIDVETSAQTIVLAASDEPYDIAADIQAKVRALSPLGFAPAAAFTQFTCRWDETLDKLILTDGVANSAPSTAAVVVTGGTAAPLLKLGVANGGTEAATGSEVITYNVYYQFVLGAGSSFGSAVVTVLSSEIASPTSIPNVITYANAKAAQLKQELLATPYINSNNSSQNGPVVLPS